MGIDEARRIVQICQAGELRDPWKGPAHYRTVEGDILQDDYHTARALLAMAELQQPPKQGRPSIHDWDAIERLAERVYYQEGHQKRIALNQRVRELYLQETRKRLSNSGHFRELIRHIWRRLERKT